MTEIDAAKLAFMKQDHNEQLLGWHGTYPKGKYSDTISKLDAAYFENSQYSPTIDEHNDFKRFSLENGIEGWEAFFVPEENYYQEVLDNVSSEDVIFDVGAGDFRLDLLLSEKVKHIYAVEIHPETVSDALKIIGLNKPSNLTVICGNGFDMLLPLDVTCVICLMIHRVHDFRYDWLRRGIRVMYAELGKDHLQIKEL